MKTYFFKAYNIDRKKVSSTLEFNSTKEFKRYLNKNRLTLISYKIITHKYIISQILSRFYTSSPDSSPAKSKFKYVSPNIVL